MISFIQRWFTLLQKKSVSDNLSIYQRILIKWCQFPQIYLAAQLFSTLMVIRAANQLIRMISEGSCDWSNDAENSDLHHIYKLHFKYIKIENRYFKL